jgi:hypothetical protein
MHARRGASHSLSASAWESPGAFYIPADVTREQLFQAIGRLRKEARDEIDRLIRFLDESENHMEREPEDEDDDTELEDDDPAEDDGSREPALGVDSPAMGVGVSLPTPRGGCRYCTEVTRHLYVCRSCIPGIHGNTGLSSKTAK